MSKEWQLLRHSAPGVPTETLLQSRYIMGATHPGETKHVGGAQGWVALGPRLLTPSC